MQNRGGELDDFWRHGGREEERLPLFRQCFQYFFNVMNEAHVEHPVGFVEHEILDVPQVKVPLTDQVEQAARRGDQNIDTPDQPLGLRILVDAAENHRVRQAGMAAIGGEALRDLNRQLPGWREHEAPDFTFFAVQMALMQ